MAKNKPSNPRKRRKLICRYSTYKKLVPVPTEDAPKYIVVAEDEAGDNHVSSSESFTRALAEVIAEIAEYGVEVQQIEIYRNLDV